MSIDLKTVDKLATLSRLSFDETEKQKIADELTKILEFVSQLQEVNTDGVEPMTSTVGSDVTQVDYDGDQWRSLQSKRGLSDFLFITPPGMAIIGRLGIW